MRKEAAKTGIAEKRDEIVRQAFGVFYRRGFHASGIESLLEGTGISKRTLYKHFESKEDLVRATIEHYQESSLGLISGFVANAKVRGAQERPLLIFDWLESRVRSGHTLGCFAMKARLEFANRDAGIEKLCDGYAGRMEALIADLATQAGCREPAKLARQLQMLLHGAILSAHGPRKLESIQAAKEAGRALVASAL